MTIGSPAIVEQFIDDYGRVTLAVGFEYDEQTTTRLGSLDWDQHHNEYNPEYQWSHGEPPETTYTLDRSPAALEFLREICGLRVPPVEKIDWNVDVYTTTPIPKSRKCEACREESILGPAGLRACNLHNTPEMEVIDSDTNDAGHVCTNCQQFYDYQFHDNEEQHAPTTAEPLTSETPLNELM